MFLKRENAGSKARYFGRSSASIRWRASNLP